MTTESYNVTELEFAALDALGEVFRQLEYFDLEPHGTASTFSFLIDGAAEISADRALAIDEWLRTVRGRHLDNPDVPIAACWVLAWGRNYAAPRESEHPNARMPGSFTTRLLDAIHIADAGNRRRLSRAFPVLVETWELWQTSQWAELHLRADAATVAKPRATTVRTVATARDLDEQTAGDVAELAEALADPIADIARGADVAEIERRALMRVDEDDMTPAQAARWAELMHAWHNDPHAVRSPPADVDELNALEACPAGCEHNPRVHGPLRGGCPSCDCTWYHPSLDELEGGD